jgi:2-polyprenyl-3-methyl-5-hydroxy-6-metoxy-1,4-benzoquinol methylase
MEVHAATRAERIARLGYDYSAQEKLDVAACNLCGGSEWTLLAQRDRYGYPARAAACWRCGLVMLNPRMTARAYVEFYATVYRPLVSAYHGRRIDADTIQVEQLAYAEEMIEFVAPLLDGRRAATLLDVGGSTGVVAASLARRFGLSATVIDPAPAETAVAERLGIQTITALLEDWQPEARYDVIGVFQTVDHLLDVTGALTKLRPALADGGLLIVDIVDFRAAYLKNWSVEEAIKIDHPYSLTQETMEAYLARNGFGAVRKAASADHHVAYACEASQPVPDATPDPTWVDEFFREVRYVQTAPRPALMR